MREASVSTPSHDSQQRPVRVSIAAQRRAAAEPSISVSVLSGLLCAVERAGVRREQLLRAAQLDVALLDTVDARLPRSKLHEVCALAMALTRDPALGLHWAEHVDEGSFVPVSHLLAHATTLRHAFEMLTQFHRLLTDQARFELLEQRDTATVQVRLPGESLVAARFCAEMTVAGFFHLLRHVNARALPDCVSFEYPAPTYHAEYVRVFQGAVLFNQPFTGVVFQRALLDMPARRKDDEVREALEALAARRLTRMTRSMSYAAQVRDFLVRERRGQRTDMNLVARALHISVRSLRRRLSAEGKPFNEIANEALALVAKHLLRDKQRSIQETAYELGFSSFSSFHRAFRRSTGTTPSAFRKGPADDDAP